MNLKEFDFPNVSKLDYAFPTFETIPELLQEARDRGFYNGRTPYNKLFSHLFYNGGKVELKENLDENLMNGWKYCKGLMRSFEPKHEEKEAVCAMIMSETLELPEEFSEK